MNHITVFSELTTGKLKAMLSGKCQYNDVLSIVQAVNKRTIYKNVLKSQVNSLVESIEFQALGYKTFEDFKATTTPGNAADKVNILITPATYYPLNENFKLKQAPDKRSQLFLLLFCDEFERIKVRALYSLEINDVPEAVSMYAVKNLQFVKTCFRSQRTVFHELFSLHPDYLHNPDAFIHYYLNYFLIRIRIFYEKLFEHFLDKSDKTEKQLLAELFQFNESATQSQTSSEAAYEISDKTNYVAEPTCNSKSKKKKQPQQELDSASPLAQAFEIIGRVYNIEPSVLKVLVSLIGNLKWNGGRNALADIIFQLMNEIKVSDKPMLETTPDIIAVLVSILCLDKDDHPISKSTIRTSLQPDKPSKRPKAGGKGKIDLNNILKFS